MDDRQTAINATVELYRDRVLDLQQAKLILRGLKASSATFEMLVRRP